MNLVYGDCDELSMDLVVGMEWRKIIYNDFGRPTPKAGYFIREDANFVYIRHEHGEVEAISKMNIVRMEIRQVPNGADADGK